MAHSVRFMAQRRQLGCILLMSSGSDLWCLTMSGVHAPVRVGGLHVCQASPC